jgi:energy-coupling factor transport system ATP-binding protein
MLARWRTGRVAPGLGELEAMPENAEPINGGRDDVLIAENLTYSYRAREGELPPRVLDGIDLGVKRGSFVAVLGHNGSGKSTLAKHFNAVLLPVGGRVLVGGMDTSDEQLVLDIRRAVGMVFQNPDNQIVASVVEEDVAFAPENLGCPSEDIRRRVDEALRVVGMSEYSGHSPHLLSGGQKQRVAIAGVLAMEPECIVFDEPTAMLDPRGRESIIRIIRRLCDELGVTVVLITHHMDEAIGADRLIVMDGGRVVMDGTPREIFGQPDALAAYGLDTPGTVSLLRGLREDGFDVPLDALTVDECADAILSALSSRR